MARRYGRSPRKTRDSAPDGINRRGTCTNPRSLGRMELMEGTAILVVQVVLIVSEDGETAFAAICFAIE